MYLLEILYSFIFIIACRYWSVLQLKNLPLWVMPSAFGIKMGVGIVFLSMYLHPDTNNFAPSDTMRFLSESEILRNVYNQSPKDYFSLLLGFGDEFYLVKKYLGDTYLWDAGSLTIINDSRNIIKIHSLIQFISFGKPFIHCLFMCFIALIGLRHLYITFLPFTKLNPLYYFFILLLFPSLLFWTSGILKEPILLLGISFLIRALLHNDHFLKRLLFTILGILLLFSIKPYVFICIVPAVIFYVFYTYIFKQKLLFTFSFFVIATTSVITLFPTKRQSIVQNLSRKQYDFDHVGRGGLYIRGDSSLLFFETSEYKNLIIDRENKWVEIVKPTKGQIVSRSNKYSPVNHFFEPDHKKRSLRYDVGGALSYIETTLINNSFIQLLKNIPEALINSYLRPLPFDPGSLLKYPAMFETWGLTFFLIYSIIKRREITPKEKGIIFSLFIFSLFLFLIIGWTTPIIGAIFRYRLPAQLACLLIGIILFKPKESLNKIQ